MSNQVKSMVERVAQAASEVLLNAPGLIDHDQGDRIEQAEKLIWERLGELGISKESVDSHSLINDGYCKEGDARHVFCEGNPPVLPVPWFRKLWSVLSGQTVSSDSSIGDSGTVASAIENAFTKNRPVSQWGDKELVESYGIDCSTEIQDEFSKRSKEQAVVAFKDENSDEVDVEVTLDVLRQSRRRRNIPKTIRKDGKVYRLMEVGQFPSVVYEESPLVPGSLLLNGYCEASQADFSDVGNRERQFIRVVVDEGEAPDIDNRMSIVGIVSTAEKGISELEKLFPNVAIKFRELDKTDGLPSLKR